jgi:hypothetical protein
VCIDCRTPRELRVRDTPTWNVMNVRTEAKKRNVQFCVVAARNRHVVSGFVPATDAIPTTAAGGCPVVALVPNPA